LGSIRDCVSAVPSHPKAPAVKREAEEDWGSPRWIRSKHRIVVTRGVNLNVGINRFPAVIWVDADKRAEAVNVIFGTRVEGQWAGLKVTLTPAQWENLKFLIDRPTQGAPPA
jgi:hypothetical protein